MTGERAGGSLRRRLIATSALTTLVVIVVGSGLLVVGDRIRGELAEATAVLLDEQRVGDAMTQAVMRQLTVASQFPLQGDSVQTAPFIAAGLVVHDRVRDYLFRDLDTEERLQIELMREEHERLEVAALRAAELYRRGIGTEGDASLQEATIHASAFVEEMGTFLEGREADVLALQARQAELFRRLNWAGGAAALTILLISVLAAWELHRRVTRPLSELVDAVDAVGAGDLSVRVPEGQDDEFRSLAGGFNRMAENLETASDRLQTRNAELATALESLRTAQDELVQSEKLSAIGRMTAGFAHELNNPLASVLGYAQLLVDRIGETVEGREVDVGEEYLRPILQEATRAQHLVQNLLHASRSPDSEVSAVCLRDVLDVVVPLRAYAFQQAGLAIEVQVDERLCVRAEPQRLQGILLNLVNNAFDAMEPRGRGTLAIAAARDDDRVEIVIQDDGPGFEQLDRVFEPFFTTKPVGEGTGLGLSMVHQSIRAFGGEVVAENREEGGARVVVRLPWAEAPELPAPSAGPRPRTAPSAESRDRAVRVLVVEDEALLRSLQERILTRLPAEVLLAGSVAEARDLLADHEVDLVVSDVKMPGESGLSFYRWVEEHRPDLTDRFLFVTGDLSGDSLVALAERHPDRFLTKPFQVTDYLQRVRRILQTIPVPE